MKAYVSDDIIVHITERGDTEIGRIPVDKRKVGLDRLRWDGTNIVDLMDCPEIWVRYNGYAFDLHAIEVPNSQKVGMSYKDRDRLVVDEGTIRLKTEGEVQLEKQGMAAQMVGNRLRKALQRTVGDPQEQLADAYKLINLLVMALIGKDKDAKDLLTEMLDDIGQTYSTPDIAKDLKQCVKDRKKILGDELP